MYSIQHKAVRNQADLPRIAGFFALFILMLTCAFPGFSEQMGGQQPSKRGFTDTVAFAGITFLGGKQDLAIQYPLTSSVVKNNNLNAILYQAILKKPPRNMTVSASSLDKDDGHKYAMSMLIDSEAVSEEQVTLSKSTVYPWWVQLSAQLVIFDVEASQLVYTKTLPILRCTDINSTAVSREAIVQRVEDMLTNNVCGDHQGLIQYFVDALYQAPAPAKASLVQFAVADVIVGDKALPYLPQRLKESGLDVYRRYVANQLTKAMSETQNIAVQPYTADQSVLQMQGRFFGGEQTYKLTLPRPYYKVIFTLRGFKKVPYSKNRAGESNYYGVFSELAVVKNLKRGDQDVFRQQLKYVTNEKIPSGFFSHEEWYFFDTNLLALIYKANTETYDDRTEFMKAQGFDRTQQRAFFKQFEKLKEAYASCRL